MTWSRVGSLTCFSRIAARCACLSRRSASFFALVALGVSFTAAGASAMEPSLQSDPRQDRGKRFPSLRENQDQHHVVATKFTVELQPDGGENRVVYLINLS